MIGTLPFRENLEDALVVCPNCNHKFHPIGHHHSFFEMDKVREMIHPHFKIIKDGEVPLIFLKLKWLTPVADYIFKLARGVLLNKEKTTIYFLARVNSSTMSQ